MSTLICDTNVWYGIAGGAIDPARLKADGHRLLASSVNWMELSSKLNLASLERRRAAARAAVAHADDFIVDTERHLASLWRLPADALNASCRDVLQIIATADDIDALAAGVSLDSRAVGRLNVSKATHWRAGVYDGFTEDVLSVLRRHYPQYATRKKNGEPRYFPDNLRSAFVDAVHAPGMIEAVVLSTRDRISHIVGEPRVDDAVDSACLVDALRPYAAMYVQYLCECATMRLPDQNDWGDLECFVYVQGDRKVLTADRKWVQMAIRAGIGDRVVHAMSRSPA